MLLCVSNILYCCGKTPKRTVHGRAGFFGLTPSEGTVLCDLEAMAGVMLFPQWREYKGADYSYYNGQKQRTIMQEEKTDTSFKSHPQCITSLAVLKVLEFSQIVSPIGNQVFKHRSQSGLSYPTHDNALTPKISKWRGPLFYILLLMFSVSEKLLQEYQNNIHLENVYGGQHKRNIENESERNRMVPDTDSV